MTGIRSAAVPGAVAGWERIVNSYGTWPLAKVLEPAIELCDRGFVVCRHLAGVYDRLESQLRRFPSTVAAMMPSGAIPATGDILVQPDLGSTLRQIAEDGAAPFYRGEFADRLEQYSREENGCLRRADLQSYECEERAPISVEHNGNTIYAQPPVSQGCALLEEIRILDDTNWAHFDPASPEAIVLMVGAKRLAFADLRRFIADPAVGECLDGDMLSDRHIESRRRELLAGLPVEEPSAVEIDSADTSCLVAADAGGNEITFIQSVAAYWGSQVVVPGTGVLLNNRMNGFSSDPSSRNAPAPGKRPLHTLMTYFVEDHGSTRLFGASMGGGYQPQTSLQFLNCVLNHGMDPQQAIDFPRWGHAENTDRTFMESRLPADVRRHFVESCGSVDVIPAWGAGTRTVAIEKSDDGRAYLAACDQRWDGSAAAL